jgi:hypothetical protein
MTTQPTLNDNLYWNWGVPDWRDERPYIATHKLTASQWRWEFIRRRPSYREDWVRWFWKEWKFIERDEEPRFRDKPGWSKDEALETMMPLDERHTERADKGMSSYMLKDPSRQFCNWTLLNKVGYRDFIVRRRPSKRARPSNVSAKVWGSYGSGFWKFDLTQPLPAQFAIAKSTLTKYQIHMYGKQNTLKPRRDLWPLYLRALDAKDAGASYDLMCKSFWPNELDKKTPQSARDVYEAAEALRNNFPF